MDKQKRQVRFLIYGAGFLRAAGVGLLGVLFAVTLSLGGLHPAQIGILVAVGIAGNAFGTFFVSFWADRLGRRNTLMVLAGCSSAGGVGLILFPGFLPLVFVCFFGMVNAFGRERGSLYTLEQAILPGMVDDQHRTRALAWYNVILDAGLAVGSLLGGLPVFLRQNAGFSEISSYQAAFFFYMVMGLLSLLLYSRMSSCAEIHEPAGWHNISPVSKKVITRISLLFGLDSFGGGFLPGTLLAYWFFKKFGLHEKDLAMLFFLAHVANAFSYPAAAWLSRRIGLVKTMVFTHIPSHCCLLALPFVPTAAAAVALFLVRECLVEMDLPTRQSYVMAVVDPSERTAAAGVTNLTRLAAWAVSPTLAGFAIGSLGLSFPLFFGGGIKIIYDLALFNSFRHIKPPEEMGKQ